MICCCDASQVCFDGSYRNRNGRSLVANIIVSLQLKSPNFRGRSMVPFDMVTLTRRLGRKAQLAPVCDLIRRKGACFIHGTEEEWNDVVKNGAMDDVVQRVNVNCYSGNRMRCVLTAQQAESLGVRWICLRLLREGFWVQRFSHDQDANVGIVVREFFKDAVECLDRAHIQVKRVHGG